MTRTLPRVLLAFILILGLVPGLGELVEQVVELATHGHFAHAIAEEGAHHSSEAGCNPVQHTCACHCTAQTAVIARLTEGPRFLDGLSWLVPNDRLDPGPAPERRRAWDDLLAAHGANAPPTPPPNPSV